MTATVPPLVSLPNVQPGVTLPARIPGGDPATAWTRQKEQYRLVSPLNTKKFTVAVVGTGLAGAGAAVSLAELGFNVQVFTYHDSPRRAHSVAAQGGINAARARKVDGDSLHRFVVDTIKGGDFRAREAEAFRLGEESARVIDHMNAIGAPFAREYGGTLATRSFGGVQVSRTYYTRGQTGQQLQIACSQVLQRQIHLGKITFHPRTEMLDLIVEDGACRGIAVRDLESGKIKAHPAHAVVLATGGYGSIYFHSTLAMNSNASAAWRAVRRGASMAYPSFVQFHPTALPISSYWQSKTILMSESLRNDGRIWVPKSPGDERPPAQIPAEDRDYYLERKYPAFGNLSPRDISSRAAKEQIDAGKGAGPLKNSVYLDFADAIAAQGKQTIASRYGNLFEMYRHATGENPYKVPMRIAPGAHFTMGGLWADFDLMTQIPGLFVAGEAGWGYHGANRLGANSLLSACVDGWFTIPFSVPNYLSGLLGVALPEPTSPAVSEAVDGAEARTQALLAIKGTRSPGSFHRQLGEIMYDKCGVTRDGASLRTAIADIKRLREDFWTDLRIEGSGSAMNQTLEKAGRVADFMELAELMCVDALDREESAGAHFRVEHQDQGEAKRDDEVWSLCSAWGVQGPHQASAAARHGNYDLTFIRNVEPLAFTAVPAVTRSYQ